MVRNRRNTLPRKHRGQRCMSIASVRDLRGGASTPDTLRPFGVPPELCHGVELLEVVRQRGMAEPEVEHGGAGAPVSVQRANDALAVAGRIEGRLGCEHELEPL